MAWRIGVDAGSSFTGVCVFDDNVGGITVWKLPSTADDTQRGITQGIGEAILQACNRAEEASAIPRLPMRIATGPSAGLTGARAIARLAGFESLISLDMGGTSSHVVVLPAGEPAAVPAPEIRSVAAGGGSIAGGGAGGRLLVGPRSAGADPGPACYGSGGTQPTVTDAHVVLQTLNPDALLGGRLKLRQALAHAAIGALAGPQGADVLAAAQEIVAAATAGVAAAIRARAVPRDATLLAYGGAGPLHAARLARALGLARVLVPPHPGVMGAIGQLLSGLRAEFSAVAPAGSGADALPAIAEALGLLRHRAAKWFSEQKVPAAGRSLIRRAEMRYAGQTGSLVVTLPDGAVTAATLDALAEEFAAAHRRRHGDATAGGQVQVVSFHLEAAGVVPRPAFPPRPDAGSDASAARSASRPVFLPEAGGWVSCPVYDRARLQTGNRFAGPAIVEQMDATTLVLPGMTVRVDPYGSLVLQTDG